MNISLTINNTQHLKHLHFALNLNQNKITCIVGKNGAGKTTLIKALGNLASADTFKKTSQDNIFNPTSSIIYVADARQYVFSFDPSINSLNSKQIIPEEIKTNIEVELPLPFGSRFTFFQSISNADRDIRQAIVLGDYGKPFELIEFLNDIYSTKKFDDLIEITVKRNSYFCILQDNGRYIREDYLSSGEFFLISLYRKIKNKCRLIVIDEIDISLDAAAQVHLIKNLRLFCKKYLVNILFTTHSLAMMQMVESDELYYMREVDGHVEIAPASYNFIKSLLFGFVGWDKYIITEDKVLKAFLEYVIIRYCSDLFYEYILIYAGGGSEAVDLMERNKNEKFFSEPHNVISILDGDQKHLPHAQKPNVLCIPFENVESRLFDAYQNTTDIPRIKQPVQNPSAKNIYKLLIKEKIMTEVSIFKYLCEKNDASMFEFSKQINQFLSSN